MPDEVTSLLEPALRPESHCYSGCLHGSALPDYRGPASVDSHLVSRCLDLCKHIFHFLLHGTETTKEELENRWRLFGQYNIVTGWGLNVDTANALLPQHIFQIPNVVITLELYYGGIGTSEILVQKLYRFLCDSPCSLYLGPEHVVVFTHVMNIN
ncbi:MAG: hypothetical protein BYD32DRAFT_464539 [Podila humilis]|nr:MAG: hypothetical protein BYD32DRAFT_464539 [Podila humilis]